GCIVKAQSGVLMINLAYQAAKIGLSGFEFMGGIPGAIGGGIYMNAGAYKYDIASVVKSVTLLNEKHQVVTYTKEQMEFSYRHSICQDNRQLVVLEAEFELTSKDPNEIKAVLDKRKERRMATQPWNMPSAGSVFRNPEQKAAWQYIDECGLRGYEIGGAQVSPKHSNFIVNNGYASAKDIYDLIMLVQDKVYEKFNVRLKREVELVNWE
ncbi:UDP-N-acetylmuramate dehydrogenase, partial [Thomasclavelia sp.]